MLYNRLSDYLKGKYGANVKKICIDGGFTCPNRDGSRGVGGCIFCGDEGSGEQILFRESSITEQIQKGVERSGDGKYIAYFQNYTNTYAPTSVLKERYLQAINHKNIVGLSIATRPDCINDEVARLLSELNALKDITVELGLQTASDSTAKAINRCYNSSEFSRAVELLNFYGIEIVVHIILGLPNEGQAEVQNTINFLNSHKYSGIKIHSLYVTEGTSLAEKYLKGEYTALTYNEYVHMVTYVLTHINSQIIVHRITGDGNKRTLLAPEWSKNKIMVINGINKQLLINNQTQGCFYLMPHGNI